MNFMHFIDTLKQEKTYDAKIRLTEYLGDLIRQRKLSQSEAKQLIDFAIVQIETVTKSVPSMTSYKEKDSALGFADSLFNLCTVADPNKTIITDAQIQVLRSFIELSNKERSLENSLTDMFELQYIGKPDIDEVIKMYDRENDQFRRGLLFYGLNQFESQFDKFTDAAKESLAEFTVKEINRLLNKQKLDEDDEATVEFAVDVCKNYYTAELGDALEKVLSVMPNSIKFYALHTLVQHGKNDLEKYQDAIESLAKDVSFAYITYMMLNDNKLARHFPEEYAKAEYLSKSDLIRWLEYPTELGKKPDEIELIGVTSVKKEIFYVFKYKSDSDNLSDDLKNVWLVGWQNDNGKTFSAFDKLCLCQKKTTEKTLGCITNKLIKKFLRNTSR